MDVRTEKRLKEQLKKWRDDLINLSRTNRLLYFKHTKTASLEIERPGSAQVLSRLSSRGGWSFYEPELVEEGEEALPPTPAINELLTDKPDPVSLERSLRLLERKANQEFVDKGLWILYLGLGCLEWIDAEDGRTVESPLLLIPVRFARESLQAPFRLVPTDDDPVINPALAVKLSTDYEIELPQVTDLDEAGPVEVQEAVAAKVRNRKGWLVRDRVVLTTFTFHKEAMYRDLLDNEELLLQHPIVQLLGLGTEAPSSASFDFDPPDEDEMDEAAPPEGLVSIRDADASQRRCIAAARDGRSFVMDGPPGTGKSQTITNLIAELMHAGKSVLFVSEKAAALDVVHNRLKAARLDEFTLELHSHKATRKAVASELGRALVTRPKAKSKFGASERADLVKERVRLSAYAKAMNTVRSPFGRTLHDVLGRVATLHYLDQAPVPSAFDTSLTPSTFADLLDVAQALGRAWGPVVRGDDFLWRDLVDSSMSTARRNDLERQVLTASESLAELRSRTEDIDEEIGLGWNRTPADARRLLRLLELLEDRRPVPSRWLSDPTLDGLEVLVGELESATATRAEAVAQLDPYTGARWTQLEGERSEHLSSRLRAMAEERPSLVLPGETVAGGLEEAVEFLRSSAVTLAEVEGDARRVADAFGLQGEPISVVRAVELGRLGQLVAAPLRPEETWLNPLMMQALADAERILSELVIDFRQRRQRLQAIFTDDVLDLDLQALKVRFEEVHRGFRKLGGSYREDKRTLAACTVAGRVTKETLTHLDEAIAWQELAGRLNKAEDRHAPLLGEHYYERNSADFDEISSAIEVARQALQLAGERADPEALRRQLGRSGEADPTVQVTAERTERAAMLWADDAYRLLGPWLDDSPTTLPLDALATWCERMARDLAAVSADVAHVDSAVGRPTTIAESTYVLEAAQRLADVVQLVASLDDEARQQIGDRYQALDTSWEAVRSDLAWADSVRALTGGSVGPPVAEAMFASVSTADELRPTIDRWDKAAGVVSSVFAEPRRSLFAADLELSFEDAAGLLDELERSVSDVEEWAQYVETTTRLRNEGLDAVVEFCIEKRVTPEVVAPTVERSILEAWVDAVIDLDASDLKPLRASDRDAAVARFRDLDKRLVEDAASTVITSCSARRPSSVAGMAGVIKRESEKKRKHRPIRTLLTDSGPVAQQLKPCFMMSPLSVSQFLPPSIRFDVVVFDEASQVRPSDAVNCIYRGNQLIVAGDQKQLPPTSFFQKMDVDGDDVYDEEQLEVFDSVLDQCKGAGGLRSLPLNWHYRSRHEHLIAFSNHRFYDGRLHTFPGALQEGSDVGVELFKVDGVYRRGTTRDNQVEAEAVIDRVLFHTEHHPELSIGVVALSSAQEDAIVGELERRSRSHPSLSSLLSDDRLHGFFVKNLENVQGDERDVIILSIGYGPDESGKLTLNFGPVNREGGYRRLNVAITRAKQRVEVVTSIASSQLDGSTNVGVGHLQRYLDFAERGPAALGIETDLTDFQEQSPFEEEVLRTVRSWGFDASPNVGVAGYRVDIGVRHPDHPGAFALGIECDGATYDSSRVARDRDRLRQSVLAGLDWNLYRVWGVSWVRDRKGEQGKLRDAILRATEEAMGTASEFEPDDEWASPDLVMVEVDFDGPPSWVVPYEVADLDRPKTRAEMHEPEARNEFRRLVESVVIQEGPVHRDRVLRLVREAWGVGRAGARIATAFDGILLGLKAKGIRQDRSGFLWSSDGELVNVRVPTDDEDSNRRVSEVPREELVLAVERFIADAQPIAKGDIVEHVARIFGWRRVGPEIRDKIEKAIAALQRKGSVTRSADGHLSLANEQSAN